MPIVLKNVRPLGSQAVDIRVEGDRISTITPVNSTVTDPDDEVIDGEGRLVFPGFIDAHTHMDKTLRDRGWHRHDVGSSLLDLIENERRVRREEAIDPYEQSSRHARATIATGVTHVRTHVDVDTEIGLRGIEGVIRTREAFSSAVSIQIVAFPQSGMLVRPGTVELLDAALSAGADLIGGLDPSSIDRDPVLHIDTIFALAQKHDVDLDIHLHEPGELGAFAIELIAERARVLGYCGRVTISHAFALGQVEDARLSTLVELLVENDIAIMTHGPGGHRAIPDIRKLRAMGVRLCTGNDGVRDAWSPLNTADMLERIYLVCYRNNLRRDDDIEGVIDVATYGGASVVGAADYGLAEGRFADLVVVDGETHVEAVISRPARSLVMKSGQVVARDGVCLVE